MLLDGKNFSIEPPPSFCDHMDMDRERLEIEIKLKLERCRQLAREFPDGPTTQHIRELENELRDQLRALEKR
jgi:hypothetical protein